MHLTFGIGDDKSIRREFDESIKKKREKEREMHSTIRTRMLPVVPYMFCLQIEGMNELSAKILMVCRVKWKWR